jgi:hypothetical protein
MPYPHSLCGAGLAEVAQTVRLPGRRIHLALRRCSQRPSIDRLALDFRQFSLRHITRVSPSTGFSVFSPLSALLAGSCPLTLSSLGKPLTQGSPLNPSHLRWGCCMNYCGAPDAGGSRLQANIRPLVPTDWHTRNSPRRLYYPCPYTWQLGDTGTAVGSGRPSPRPCASP